MKDTAQPPKQTRKALIQRMKTILNFDTQHLTPSPLPTDKFLRSFFGFWLSFGKISDLGPSAAKILKIQISQMNSVILRHFRKIFFLGSRVKAVGDLVEAFMEEMGDLVDYHVELMVSSPRDGRRQAHQKRFQNELLVFVSKLIFCCWVISLFFGVFLFDYFFEFDFKKIK